MPRSASASPAHFDADDDVFRFEESNDFSNYPPRSNGSAPPQVEMQADPDHLEDLKRKQTELLHLRQALETKEREATELENRRQKEERFSAGRRNICEQLSRTMVRLERELDSAQKAIDEITIARAHFERHLEILRGHQPESWQRAQMDNELDEALGAMEDAEDEYARCMRRLNTVLSQSNRGVSHGGSVPAGGAPFSLNGDFRTWLRAGTIFALPLGLIIALTLVAIKLLLH